MQKFNLAKIKKVLSAASETDFYSRLFKCNGIDIKEINDYNSFCSIPITTKAEYRENKYDFIHNNIKKRLEIDKLKYCVNDFKTCDRLLGRAGLDMVITSGSTGLPLEVIHSAKDNYRNYISLNHYRRTWSGFNISDKYIWILPMNEKTKRIFYSADIKYLKENNGIQYFLANYEDSNLEELHNLIVSEMPGWITGSPMAVASYAGYLLKHNLFYKFKYIELHSEPCLNWQAKAIKAVLGDQISCVYSSNEINFIAASRECGHLHILEDNVFVELIPSIQQGIQSKKVVVTGLNYFDTPMIRYEIGDLAEEVVCETIKTPALRLTGYRDSDMIYLEDGTICEPYIIYDSIFFLNSEFKVDVEIYQVIQIHFNVFQYKINNAMTKQQQQQFTEFLEEFLCISLKQKVYVKIEKFSNNELKVNSKYKRFATMVR